MGKSIIIKTDELQYYLKDLKKIPVISHEREDEIFELLKNPNLPKRDELKKEVIIGNLRFVISQAKLYQNQGLDLSDLISEGNIGLMKSIDRYDKSSGVKFISYGVWWIKQFIMSALNDHSRTIRIPSNIIQDTQKSKKEKLKEEKNTPNNIKLDNLPYCVGLYDEINEEGGQLIDIIRDPNENNPEQRTLNSKEDIKRKVDMVLSVLDEREKIIIEKYFGLNGIESNLDDLGEEFNCTKERVRQLKEKAIKKLRNESYRLITYL